MILVGILMFGSTGAYRVTLLLENGSQLVRGNEVKVGGVPVGTIQSIDLTEDFQAKVELEITDPSLRPLHRGTRAVVRYDSLLGLAGRYVALTPGPSNTEEIEDGGVIRGDHTRGAVDPDEVFQTLDEEVQKDLRVLLRRSPIILEGNAAQQANAGFQALSPVLSQSAALAHELARDERALRRLVTESADVVSAVASRPEDIEQLTGNALNTTSALAERSEALDSVLGQLPPVLRRTNSALVNLRATLRDLRPLVRDARPAVGPLRRVLARARPLTRDARPVVTRLRRVIRRPGRTNDLLEVLRGIVPVARQAVPAFRSTAQVLRDLAPVVTELRPYTPDLAGLANAFGATPGGYYDANGRYFRISFQGSLFSLNNAGQLVELPELDALQGLRKGLLKRCPGAATQRLPDGSNPYFEVPGTCRLEDMPR